MGGMAAHSRAHQQSLEDILQTARPMQDPGAGASSEQPLSGQEGEEPCYVELGMRKEGDRRLASVYKPEQRAKLQVSAEPCYKASIVEPAVGVRRGLAVAHGLGFKACASKPVCLGFACT